MFVAKFRVAVRASAAAFILFGLSLALSGRASAQSGIQGTVEGAVVIKGGTPAAGIAVALGHDRRTITDSIGRFRFEGVAPGDAKVVIRAPGFRPAAQLVSVTAFSTARVDIILEPATVTLADIVVSTAREAELVSRTPLSIDVIGAEEIRTARSHHPSDLVNRAAGAHVSSLGGEGHATAIRQPITTKAVYAYLEDGVPIRSTGFFNHNALYEINLPQAGRVEIIKGPGTAVYGSDAVGGVISSFTRDPATTPEAEFFLEGGSGGYVRALGTTSSTAGIHGLRLDANVTRSSGWRRGAPYDRQSGTLRWDVDLGAGARLKSVATVSHIDQPGDGGGDLSAAAFAETPRIVQTAIAFRRVLAGRASSELELRRGPSRIGVTVYARHSELDLLPSWQLSFDPQIWESRHRSIGMLTRYRLALAPLGASLSAGLDAEYSPGSRLETRIVPASSGSVYSGYTAAEVQYDYDVAFWQLAPYAQADIAATQNIRLDVGVRFDNLGYDYTTRLDPLDSGAHRRPASTAVGFSRWSPKVGAAWELRPGVTVFTSWRAAFRAPSESQLFRQGAAESSVDLQPVKAQSVEAGMRARIGDAMSVEATVYSLRLSDDIRTFFDPATGLRLTQNAGATSHRGVELGFGIAPLRGIRLDAAAAYAKHAYDEWRPRANLDYVGNEMELAPRLVFNARLTLRPAFLPGASASLEWARLGSYYMDPGNTHRYGGHSLFNLQASMVVHGNLELVGRVTNITNRRYAEASSFNAQQGERFRPGAPRQVFVGAQYRFSR